MEKYVDQYIWIRTDGGVIGYDLEYITRKITEYNNNSILVKYLSFWDWLTYEEGINLYGFSSLWHSKLMSKLPIIKGGL